MLSNDPDATSLPLGLKATEVTFFLWPSSVCMNSFLSTSHSLMVSSEHPDAISLPSGLKAIELT